MFDQPAFPGKSARDIPVATVMLALVVVLMAVGFCRNFSMVQPVISNLAALLLLVLVATYAGAFLVNAAYLAIRLRPASKISGVSAPSWRGLSVPPAWYAAALYIAILAPRIMTNALENVAPPVSTIGLILIALVAPPLVYFMLMAGYRVAKADLVRATSTSDPK